MTLGDLKQVIDNMIEEVGEDIEVYAVSDYGDRTHTQQLVELNEPRVTVPYKTAYSNSGLAVRNCDEEDDGETPNEDDRVVVL